MKKIIFGLTLLTSMSSFADVTLSSAEGDLYNGKDAATGKACTVQIIKFGQDRAGRLKVYVEASISNKTITSVLSNVGHTFRGEEPGLDGDRLYSNLFVDGNGNPQTFDLSEYNSGKTILTCDNLKK